MKTYILKALSIAIFCFSFALSTDVRSMEIPEEYSDTGRSCTHWGLKRWIYGIKEYVIDRCLCCGFECCGFDSIDGDRAYIKESDWGDIVTTDCWWVTLGDFCRPDSGCGWISGTYGLPCATLTHLICLPVACCYPTKDDWRGTEESQRIGECVSKHKERQRKEAGFGQTYGDSRWQSSQQTTMRTTMFYGMGLDTSGFSR